MSLQTLFYNWHSPSAEALPFVPPYEIGIESAALQTHLAAPELPLADPLVDTGALNAARDPWIRWQDTYYTNHFRDGLMRNLSHCALAGLAPDEVLLAIDDLEMPTEPSILAAEGMLAAILAAKPNEEDALEFTPEDIAQLAPPPPPSLTSQRERLVMSLHMAERFSAADFEAIAVLKFALKAFDANHPELIQ